MVIYQMLMKNQLNKIQIWCQILFKIILFAIKPLFLKIVNNTKNKLNSEGYLPIV